MALNTIQKLSIAAPAYNEAQGITAIIEGWHAYLKNAEGLGAFEIVVCDDGSKDGTGQILDDLATRLKEFKVVHHSKNLGAAAALSTAIRNTTGEWVLLLDCDGQFPIENLANFRRSLSEHTSAAFMGARARKEDSWFARFGSWSSGAVCNWCYRTRYRDFNSACKMVRGDMLRALHLEAKGLNYSTEITAKLIEAGCPPQEIPIVHERRKHGKSSRSMLAGSIQRLLFVKYLIYRQVLFALKVLQRPSERQDRTYD